MIFYRPQSDKPFWRWRFIWCRRIGDYIVVMQWVRTWYEESTDGKTWKLVWHNRDLDGDPFYTETGDVTVF